MIRFIILLILIPVIIVITAFSYRNAAPVSVDLFTVVTDLPLALLLLLCLLLGGIMGFMLNLSGLLSLKAQIRQVKKKKAAMKSLSEMFKQSDSSGPQ